MVDKILEYVLPAGSGAGLYAVFNYFLEKRKNSALATQEENKATSISLENDKTRIEINKMIADGYAGFVENHNKNFELQKKQIEEQREQIEKLIKKDKKKDEDAATLNTTIKKLREDYNILKTKYTKLEKEYNDLIKKVKVM